MLIGSHLNLKTGLLELEPILLSGKIVVVQCTGLLLRAEGMQTIGITEYMIVCIQFIKDVIS